jgi:serine/threonine-protein kinase RsbT
VAVTDRTLFRFRLVDESDVAAARQRIRDVARTYAMPEPELEALATAVSEVVRNVIVHAGQGELSVGVAGDGERPALVVVVRDDGPGIADPDAAMRDGFSTGQGLGLGLPSARRLVDAFALSSVPGAGTVVTLRKWLTR